MALMWGLLPSASGDGRIYLEWPGWVGRRQSAFPACLPRSGHSASGQTPSPQFGSVRITRHSAWRPIRSSCRASGLPNSRHACGRRKRVIVLPGKPEAFMASRVRDSRGPAAWVKICRSIIHVAIRPRDTACSCKPTRRCAIPPEMDRLNLSC